MTARSSSSDSRIGRASAVMAEPISRGRLLAAVSVAQLATGVAGLVVALRRRLRPSGWDPVETSLAVVGVGLAGAMAALGSQAERRGGTGRSPSPIRTRRGRGGGQSVREGTLCGGLPYLAVGAGPPLVVFSGLTAEHANPTGLGR